MSDRAIDRLHDFSLPNTDNVQAFAKACFLDGMRAAAEICEHDEDSGFADRFECADLIRNRAAELEKGK